MTSWTENASRYWVGEPMARVVVPSEVPCPTPECKADGTKAKAHDCKSKECTWFYCDRCKLTTWMGLQQTKGKLGNTINSWRYKAVRWVG